MNRMLTLAAVVLALTAWLAADVADATCGLARLWHMPNGAMLTFGLWSMMFAIGTPSALTLPAGRTVSVPGDMPNEHIIEAPDATAIAIVQLPLRGVFGLVAASSAAAAAHC